MNCLMPGSNVSMTITIPHQGTWQPISTIDNNIWLNLVLDNNRPIYMAKFGTGSCIFASKNRGVGRNFSRGGRFKC